MNLYLFFILAPPHRSCAHIRASFTMTWIISKTFWHTCMRVCAHALRHLGSATKKRFLLLLRNAAFLWCRLSVTLCWSGLERGRANSVSGWSQRSDKACHSGCGDGRLGWETVGMKLNCYWIAPCVKIILKCLFLFWIFRLKNGEMCHTTAGCVAPNCSANHPKQMNAWYFSSEGNGCAAVWDTVQLLVSGEGEVSVISSAGKPEKLLQTENGGAKLPL